MSGPTSNGYHPYPSAHPGHPAPPLPLQETPPHKRQRLYDQGIPSAGSVSGSVVPDEDEDQGRSRNARAQRRHREKRKAHVKALEESVTLLTSQLEDARRYAFHHDQHPPTSPDQKAFANLTAENSFLREENAELRRQLHAYRSGYGGHPPPAQSIDGRWGEDVKGESGQNLGISYPGQGQGQGQHLSPRGPHDRDGSLNESSSNPSTSSGFPPLDHITPLSRPSRSSRVPSASSAPTASPFNSTQAFPTDPRHHALSSHPGSSTNTPIPHAHMGSGGGGGGSAANGGRFDHMYPPTIPPPHSMPRMAYPVDLYGREGEMWGPEAGPPPFPGGPPTYGMSYPQQQQSQQQQPQQADGRGQEEWTDHHG